MPNGALHPAELKLPAWCPAQLNNALSGIAPSIRVYGVTGVRCDAATWEHARAETLCTTVVYRVRVASGSYNVGI
jgi:hypothetical protein